jgi:hypothetical protein
LVDWIDPQRSYPGAPRFPKISTIAIVESRIERGEKIETEQRSYVSSWAQGRSSAAVAPRNSGTGGRGRRSNNSVPRPSEPRAILKIDQARIVRVGRTVRFLVKAAGKDEACELDC